MKPSTSIALAAIGIGSLALSIPLATARAQVQSQESYTVGQQVEGRMIAPMPAQFGPGAPSTMVADGNNLYIVQGYRLFRVDKSSLRVEQEGMLPGPPRMESERLTPGAPARAGRGGGGEKQ